VPPEPRSLLGARRTVSAVMGWVKDGKPQVRAHIRRSRGYKEE
jgi:hypothetical protein